MTAIKIVLLGFTALLIVGCLENEMEKASELWDKVLASENATEEAEHIKAVRKLIADEDMTIIVNVENSEGKMVNINSMPEGAGFSSVQVIFDTHKGEFQAPQWSPKNPENVFLLFLE
jgi:hypothetical protein